MRPRKPPAMPVAFRQLLSVLNQHRVEYAVVGGVAMILQGSARTTLDLDICYSREPVNLARLAAALEPLHPRLRGAPAGLPFHLDSATLRQGLNFTLESDAGAVDLMGEITGIGDYAAVLSFCEPTLVFGLQLNLLGLDGLERAKTAAGRLKDALDVAEIRQIRALRAPPAARARPGSQ